MQIADVLSKVNAGETLSDEEKTFLADYKEPDVSSASDAAAASARKKAEAEHKKATKALQDQLDELTERLEEAEEGAGSKGSDLEKIQRQLDRASKKLAAAEAKVSELEKTNSGIHREHGFEKVLGKVQFVDDQSRKAGELLLKQSLSEVEDLTDESETGPILDAFKTEFPRLIAAPGGSGTGVKSGSGSGGGGGGAKGLERIKEIQAMNPAERTQEHLNEMWKLQHEIDAAAG